MSINELEEGITKAIKETTIEVFSTMLMMDVKPEDSFVKDEKNINTDLISSLHFFGEKYMGKIAIFSSGNVACNISNSMLGTEETMVNDEIKDGMGELVNMVAGGAKVKLLDTLGDIHLLTPWVIAGSHLTIASASDSDNDLSIDSQAQFSWVMTKFDFEKGSFLVGVQTNEVPKRNNDAPKKGLGSEDLKKENTKLKKENTNLKKEIKSLKSVKVDM